ncbi:hypothetical protein H0H87_009577 [Tephrocybe sp. NHM501043]|nr:hypothetical protein H0H87_009577 [Tephrocybe sp. NHM501043]
MATLAQTRPEPMNSSPHHPKVKVSMMLVNPIYVAGKFVAGKMEVECRADIGLGIGIILVELLAIQGKSILIFCSTKLKWQHAELTSRDHSATSTFLHSRRLFQGPGLPPSNAVQAYPQPGDPSYPLDYHQARRGISTFLFRIPLPSSAPSSISFGSDLARVRYELRATVGVVWKGEKRLVVCKREIDVVESFEEDFSRTTPEGVVIGEFGKIWVQGTVVGGIVVAGESGCVELQVKNHSNKKVHEPITDALQNTGLTLALTRTLVLPGLKPGETPPLQISDVLTTVPFRGPEYIIPSGAEGVASLVFDVPKHARGVRGGELEGDERSTQSLFEVRCIVDPEEGKGERATRVTQHLRTSSRHRSVSPQSHRFPLLAPPAGAPQTLLSAPSVEQPSITHLRNLPPAPLLPSVPIPVTDPVVHSPRPFLSPKRSFDGSLPKSDRVEELERMAEEVEKTMVDLSSDLPKTNLEPLDATLFVNPSPPQVPESRSVESEINKTLPKPPLVTKKAKDLGSTKQRGRTRIDEFFANTPPSQAPPTPMAAAKPVKLPSKAKSAEFRAQRYPNGQETLAPPTPMAAVTPMKLPSKTKSAEFRTQLDPNGPSESGLDALEKRLLAEVGTRKIDLGLGDERRPAWSVMGVQPINIPSKDALPDDPLNDSAISSLTLAGEWMGADRDEVEIGGALELDVEHDSDEKTHRAGKSSASASSRKGSKGKGDKAKKKAKKGKDKVDGEGSHGRTRKKAAAKGRVAAWLGGIDPEVPPMEESLPPSPVVSRKLPPFMNSIDDSFLADDGAVTVVVGANEPLAVSEPQVSKDGASAPNPRSSGFVPIGTFKSGMSPRPFKSLSKDATIVREAQRVADIWSSSAWIPTCAASPPVNNRPSFPVLKDVAPAFPSIALAQPTAASIQTDHKVSPPSAAGVVDVLGAKHYNINAGRLPSANLKSPNMKKSPPLSPPAIPILSPPLDSEVRYDVRSARGGRGGRVTAITSVWASGATSPNSQPTRDILPPSKPLRNQFSGPAVKDITARATTAADSTPAMPKLLPRAPMKSLLTAGTPPTPQNPDSQPAVAAKRPKPIIKSTSVPAIISSSHATPMLSSTASLARPTPVKTHIPPAKLPQTISEARSNPGRRFQAQAPTLKTAASSTQPVGGEMAFGQARLRDLIKKYQGQAT